MLLESYRNFCELTRAREPFLTIGIGVALPFLNPRLSQLGIEIYRGFRNLDNEVEAEVNPISKGIMADSELLSFNNRSPRSRFQIVNQTNDSFLIQSVRMALEEILTEQEFEQSREACDEDVHWIKVGNSFPYQVIAAYLLFGKKIDSEDDKVYNFQILSGLLQNGDDLRDLADDIFRHRLHFTYEEKQRLIRNNKFSIWGLIIETWINIGHATAQVARTKEIPGLPNWLTFFWKLGNYSKIIVDAAATIFPTNLYKLSKVRISDDILKNI